MEKRKERELPDAYPQFRHDQVTFDWTSTEKFTLLWEREPTATRSQSLKVGRFELREQEQFAQVYVKCQNGFRITFVVNN